MKLFIPFLAAAALGCPKAHANMEQITNKDVVADYVAVVTEAFIAAPTVKCVSGKNNTKQDAVGFIARQLRQAEEVWVDPTGAQPAILVVSFSNDRKTRYSSRITTSNDLEEVAALSSEYSDLERINKGNLVALKMVDEYILKQTITCDTRP